MPIPLPNLDDRTFADLVSEGRAMIPRLAPLWTNHNPSDPGITAKELLAWLTEMVLYRLNQVPDENYRTFLFLLGVSMPAGRPTEDGIREAVESLGALTRAVGPRDFDELARSVPEVARAAALPDQNLEGTTAEGEAHVSVVILPFPAALGLGADPAAHDCASLSAALAGPGMAGIRNGVSAALRERRLLTTELHVVPPSLVNVEVRARVVGEPDADPSRLVTEAETAVRTFLDPWDGGDEGEGWPFGRALYKSELLQRLEDVPGVDHVETLTVNDDPTDNPVPLAPHQLFCVRGVSVAATSGAEP